jgi:hypothetical protein
MVLYNEHIMLLHLFLAFSLISITSYLYKVSVCGCKVIEKCHNLRNTSNGTVYDKTHIGYTFNKYMVKYVTLLRDFPQATNTMCEKTVPHQYL